MRDWWYCGTSFGDIMAAQAQPSGTAAGKRPSGTAAGKRPSETAAGKRRRSSAGLWLSQRDIDGLLLCGEHYGAPFDLLGAALGTSQIALFEVVRRWRRAEYAAAGRLGPGPLWCWLTREGMTATGLRFSAGRPALGRLAHIRAVLAARLWLEGGQAWQDGQAWWRSERRLHTGRPRSATGHVPDAEVHWPSIEGSPHAGQIWALEVELSPKPIARTTGIMAELLSPMRYATVVYLAAPAARSVVLRAVASFPEPERSRVAVRDLPATAFGPEPPR
jgi:hypothetical protein